MEEIKLIGVTNGSYDLRGNIHFKTKNTTASYTMSQKDALEIAYTLVDSLGLDYKILDQVDDAVNGSEE